MTEKTPLRRYGAWVIGVAIVLAVIAGVINLTEQPADPEAQIKADVIQACRSQVQKQLKSPSTAKWSGEHVTTLGSGTGPAYRITGNVDSQNGFGATVRSSFTCETERFDGGSMLTKMVSLG